MPLAPALAQHDGVWGAVADAEVLDRLGVKLGDRITVGKLTYELRAVIAREPDRGAGAFLLGPRLMVAQASLAETGLIQPGSLIYRLYRIAYRPGLDDKAFRATLDRRFPDAGWRLRGLDDASPGVKRFVDRTALFLTLVGSRRCSSAGSASAMRSRPSWRARPRPSPSSNAWAPRPGPSSPSISP